MSTGLPAAVQPEVVMISEGRVTNTAATVRGDDDDDDNTESDDEQLVGAVGGVGISDQQVKVWQQGVGISDQ